MQVNHDELSDVSTGLYTHVSCPSLLLIFCLRQKQLRIMKLATILAWAGLATSIYCLAPSHVSIERNVTLTKHLGSSVDHLKLGVELVDSKFLSAPNVAQITSEKFDINDIATPEEWQRYVGKGGFLGCLLDMSDEKAGEAWPDPLGRTPKSASSQWVGTLERKQFFMDQEVGCCS
jgi:hypothetical protein